MTMKDALAHYGMPRRSGRYPWGSGDVPYQRGGVDFLGRIEQLQKENPGAKEKDIADMLGMTINEMRDREAISRIYRRNNKIAQLQHLIERRFVCKCCYRQNGYSRVNSKIAS